MSQCYALRHPQNITVRHTRSHVGDPGNEVADALAKRACRGGGAVDAAVLPDIAQTAARSSFAWLWLLVEAIRRPEAWPTFQYQALWDGPSPPPELPTVAECASFFGLASLPDRTPVGQAQATICACLLTVNVQTLYPQDGDVDPDAPPGAFIGRARFLRDQLQAEGIAVTAVQETRSRQSETFISATHIRYTSEKHTDGSGGVELWFSRDHAFLYDGHDKPVLFQPDDFLAVYWKSGVLAVRFSPAALRILFVCVHVPHNASSERDAWWSTLLGVLQRTAQGAHLVLLGDFNLHFERSRQEAIGDLVWRTQHPPPPPAVWTILDAFALWIPSTFEYCHPGETDTWYPPSGSGAARLDYIAVPGRGRCRRPAAGQTPLSLDWGQQRANHCSSILGPGLRPSWTPFQPDSTPCYAGLLRDSKLYARSAEVCHCSPGM